MPLYRHFSNSRCRILKEKKLLKKRVVPFWLQLLGAIGGIITGALSIYIGVISIGLQRQANALASNDTLQRAQIDTLTRAVGELRLLNEQSISLNSQVVNLVEEARNQSKISLLSDEPQIGIVKPVISYTKPVLDDDSSRFPDGASFNQSIVFKNYGRREAIPKAIYVYLFNIQPSKFENDKSINKNSFSNILPLAKASTGAIDPTINYQEIAPGDTLGYSFSTNIGGYWNADDLINDYEVVKLIYQDPRKGEKEKKFYFQYDSNASVNFAIPKSIQNALDSLTKKPPSTTKGNIKLFEGIIRPNR